MTYENVITEFLFKKPASGSNIFSMKDPRSNIIRLFSYITCIGEIYEDILILNKTKYSPTTSKHQNKLHNIAKDCFTNYTIKEVSDIPKGANQIVGFLNKYKDLL